MKKIYLTSTKDWTKLNRKKKNTQIYRYKRKWWWTFSFFSNQYSEFKVKCSISDLSNINRVGKPSKAKPRTILIEFVSLLKRNEINNAKNSLKYLNIHKQKLNWKKINYYNLLRWSMEYAMPVLEEDSYTLIRIIIF